MTAARFFSNLHVFVGALAAGLATAAGGSAFVAREWITGLLAILAAAGTGLLTSLRPDERSQSHWKAAAAYWALADDVYMTFRFGTAPLPPTRDSHESDDEQGKVEKEGPTDESVRTESPLQQVRSFQIDYQRLETVGPPVPLRLVRKAERWIATNDEWFPPQYRKFQQWRGVREQERPPERRGLIRWIWAGLSRLW